MMTRRSARPARSLTLAIGASFLFVGLAAVQNASHGGDPPATGLRAELISDIGVLEEKYTSLAEALAGHFAWRPSEGVRSVSEVFMHVAGANFYIPVALDVAPPAGMEVASLDEGFARMAELEGTTEAAAVLETLRAGFDHARHVVASVSEEDFEEEVTVFGQTFTKRQALVGMVTHMHEHLGQTVAYARMNGVVPPWSGGG